MVDLAEVKARTHEVASALNGARAVLGRVENLLAEQAVDEELTRRLNDVQSFGRSAERVSRLEQEAVPKRRVAWETEHPRAVAESQEADAALGSAFRDSLGEAGPIRPKLQQPWQDLAGLRDDLRVSSEQLKKAMEHADALDRMPEYDGPKHQLANVRGVKEIVDKAEEGVAEAAARVDAARTIVFRFEQDPPVIRSGQLATEITSTSDKLWNELSGAQDKVRDVRGPVGSKRADVAKATDQAIGASDAAKDAHKAAEDLAKNMQAGTTPRPPSAQHAESSSQQDLRRRLDGKAQSSSVER
ncbi:hypothetical protein [Kribbella sp. VKM Ac-2566]|uniref:hypothetical protein n=1 Tax=Kribbella sp. VKM Ac-2566 TaxID=2512218 RepID=UPI001063A6AA|nr:hypothetical protein [Kribbella sp. VKM Ac-2566]TDX03166.1 hypothetical protein EV647_1397 [Kribbella sp. VKM Ac-2566]